MHAGLLSFILKNEGSILGLRANFESFTILANSAKADDAKL